jgi:hypothetical protein
MCSPCVIFDSTFEIDFNVVGESAACEGKGHARSHINNKDRKKNALPFGKDKSSFPILMLASIQQT